MKSKLTTSIAFAVALFTCSQGFAQDLPTCRERNLKSLINKIEMSQESDSQQAKMMLISLGHQLQVQTKIREQQFVNKTPPANAGNEEPAVDCPECFDGEGNQNKRSE